VSDLTVIYYSSNREGPHFEGRVRRTLRRAIENLPVIAVTQKEVNFGRNICIGDVGASLENMLHQIKIGALVAQTRFVALAESDTLYHPSYFAFRPDRDDTFYYTDRFYVLWKAKHRIFWPKRRREFSAVVGRKHLIETIEKVQTNLKQYVVTTIGKLSRQETFHPEAAVISLKTQQGMNYGCPISQEGCTRELPYWGTAAEVHKRYWRR